MRATITKEAYGPIYVPFITITNVPWVLRIVLERGEHDLFHASKFANLIGENVIFLSVADAVRTFAPNTEQP